MTTQKISSPKAMQKLGAKIGKKANPGDIYLLKGELGAGKTQFAGGFIKALCKDSHETLSPTFSLLNLYATDSGQQIYHYDLYRVEKETELRELGLEEAFSEGITLIEWPERLGNNQPKKAITINIKIINNQEREVIIE